MADDIDIPANERDIAAAVARCAPYDKITIRRLAFERDMLLYRLSCEQQHTLCAIESILDAWDDWDAEAQQTAQQEQNADAWRFEMRDRLRECLSRHFGWTMEAAP